MKRKLATTVENCAVSKTVSRAENCHVPEQKAAKPIDWNQVPSGKKAFFYMPTEMQKQSKQRRKALQQCCQKVEHSRRLIASLFGVKSQIERPTRLTTLHLELSHWNFFGAWSLELGAY